MNKKKIIAIVLPIVLVILIGLIVLIVLLTSGGSQDPCKEGHAYDYTQVDGTNHKVTCKNCPHVNETQAHVYDNDEDTTCNYCEYVRTLPHEHTEEYEPADETNHRHYCTECDELDELLPHVYDDDEDTTCNDCEYVRTIHEHSEEYEPADENEHRHYCTDCDELDEFLPHVYDDDEDMICNDCEYVRTIHEHSEEYEPADENEHRHYCTDCDELDELLPHVYDDDEDMICNDCAYDRTPSPNYPYDTPSGITISTSTNEIAPGDTFELYATVQANMPGYVWHSVSLTIAVLGEDNDVDFNLSPYFELVSVTTNLGFLDFFNTCNARFNSTNGKECGVTVSFTNNFMNTEQINTSASRIIEVTFVLKLSEDAPENSNFTFGILPIKSNTVAFRDLSTGDTVIHRADGVISENFIEVESGITCITMNTVPMVIKPKED